MQTPEKPDDRSNGASGMGIGIAVGVGLGAAMDNMGTGIAIGAALATGQRSRKPSAEQADQADPNDEDAPGSG